MLVADALAGGLSDLSELDVSSNDVSEQGLDLLAASLSTRSAPRLLTLRLGEGAYADHVRAPLALAQLLGACSSLTAFHLTGDALRGADFAPFFGALADAPQLTTVELSRCSLGDEQG